MCREIPKGTPPMDLAQVNAHLAELPGWEVTSGGKAIAREFKFRNFYETMSFVNAAAHVANTQDHHPDLAVSYNVCRITYNTHTVGGISENDLICAARIQSLGGTKQ
jgi:4a-hydroxytetrahydrobiopterin dehydratase